MLQVIIYLVVTVAVGLVLSFLALTFRSTKQRGDRGSVSTITFCLVLCIGGPFAFTEAVTHLVGPKMEGAIKKAYKSGPIAGPMQYYRVTRFTGSTAQAIAVGLERSNWGGTDRPILGIDLKKDGDQWRAVSYRLIYSDRAGKDGIVLPPYR